MTIQQIYYVITIADIGSLNKASEVLYVAQPSLTSAVQELERELGITIFYRSGRGVTLTNEGEDFLSYARPLYQQYAQLTERYGKGGTRKKKFGVSAQHYSFAVKCFAELMKQYSTAEYEFAIRETKTLEVIDDVHTGKSELGVLFLSDFNRKALEKLFRTQKLSFQKLVIQRFETEERGGQGKREHDREHDQEAAEGIASHGPQADPGLHPEVLFKRFGKP